MADPAVLEPGNALEIPEAPEQEINPVVETPVAEMAEEEAPSADSAGKEEAPQKSASPFAGKTLDEIAADPEVEKVLKDRLAKERESNRGKLEHAQKQAVRKAQEKQYETLRNAASQQSFDWGYRNLASLVRKVVDEGSGEIPDQPMRQIAASLNLSAIVAANEEMATSLANRFNSRHKGVKVPDDLNDAFMQAYHSRNPAAMVDAWLEANAYADREALKKQVKQEMLQEAKAEKAVAAKKQAATTAKSAPRPSTLRDGGTPQGRPVGDILSDQTVSYADKAKIFKQTYGIEAPWLT